MADLVVCGCMLDGLSQFVWGSQIPSTVCDRC